MANKFSVDDSSSMTFDKQHIPALRDTLRRVTYFATRLQPKGISIRFLNHSEGVGKTFDDLTDAHDIDMKVGNVPFQGNTRLGEVLDAKIVQPMILKKVLLGKLERPVFVVLITDGQVCYHNIHDCMRTHILLVSPTASPYVHSLKSSSLPPSIPKVYETLSATVKKFLAVNHIKTQRQSSSSHRLAMTRVPRCFSRALKPISKSAAWSSAPLRICLQNSRVSKVINKTNNIPLG